MLNNLNSLWPKKWPTIDQWQRFPKTLNKKELLLFIFLCIVSLLSLLYAFVIFYYSNTEIIPAKGGVYKEGVIESTRWVNINPIYESHSDIAKDIIEITFAELIQIDSNGNIISRLAKNYHTEDNKIFYIELRDDIYWSDGKKITTDDVIFTIETILNPNYESSLRQKWTGVEVEKISSQKVQFALESPSVIFLENLQLRIIPEHIFDSYSPQDFRYSQYNMTPIVSGPYYVKNITEENDGKIKSVKLERNPYYFDTAPFINEVHFYFFNNKEEVITAYKDGSIDGFAVPDGFAKEMTINTNGIIDYRAIMPRYFAVLFNLQNDFITSEKYIREALSYATNKKQLIDNVLNGQGHSIDSPLLPSFYGFGLPENIYQYDIEKAKEILEKEGFVDGKKKPENIFLFTENLSLESQGEEVRNLQRCFIYLQENEDEKTIYPQEEVTGFFDENTANAVSSFQELYAEEILTPHNFTKGTGMVAGSTREKLNEVCFDLFNKDILLEITLTTLDSPILIDTAYELKKQWEEIGVITTINSQSSSVFREKNINQREFEALLFGIMLSETPNPFPLWHSSKIDYPGLNLCGFSDKEVDKMIEQTIFTEGEERYDLLNNIQQEILSNAPGIFLYNPYFLYSISNKVKGIEQGSIISPYKRFSDIENWYINTKRVWKKN